MRRPCCDKKHINKGAWTEEEEDKELVDYIQTNGEGCCWLTLPKQAGLHRCGKSCSLRWMNYLRLRPDLKRRNFTEDEEDLIVKLHALLGNRWSLIAGRLPGRTENEVKMYWNSHIKRKLITMGIDPNNHRLNQTISHHKNHPDRSDQLHASSSINSSSTATIKAPFKPKPDEEDDEDDDDELLSDAASGPEP